MANYSCKFGCGASFSSQLKLARHYGSCSNRPMANKASKGSTEARSNKVKGKCGQEFRSEYHYSQHKKKCKTCGP